MKNYTATDQKLHFLSQVITKVNSAFVPEKEDDSHTNLYFDPFNMRIFGRWFTAKDRKHIFAFNLNAYQFELLNDNNQVELSVDPTGKYLSDIEVALKHKMNESGFETSTLLNPLHFEIPTYDFSGAVINEIPSVELSQWSHYRALANYACFDLSGLAQAATEVRIWPHHFDTGIYFEPNDKIGIGFGLAMEDEMVGIPYFYMSAYPKNHEIDYTKIQESPEWKWFIREDWKGCILSLEVIQNQSEKAQYTTIANYFKKIYSWFLTQ